MEHATLIAKCPTGQEQVYFWRSNQEVLFLRNAVGTPHYEAICLEINNGSEKPLTAFNAEYRTQMWGHPMTMRFIDANAKPARPSEIIFTPPACSLSPDGTWLVWCGGKRGFTRWIAATLDGRCQMICRQAHIERQTMIWMPDSRFLIELVQSHRHSISRFTGAILRDTEARVDTQLIRLTGASDGKVLGITDRGELLIQNGWFGPEQLRSEVVLSYCGLNPDVAVTRERTIRLPHPAEIHDVVLSPRGDRLAWALGNTACLGADDAVVGLWISDLKGGDMHQVESAAVAEVRTGSDGHDVQYSWIDDLRWLPDGKRVSFLYQTGLYAISVA
jgi:hypothetical protein